ncbi:hypothetical protein NHX12_028010, partial [Muraenolepis orangiensis]
IFAGRWVLQEAYSSNPIDQNALTNSRSSWAEFSREPQGTIYLHMAHMLKGPVERVCKVPVPKGLQ